MPPSLSAVFDRVFDCIEVAEEEIQAAIASTNDSSLKERFDSAFKHLLPTDPLCRVGDYVYRSHASELIQRVGAEEDVGPGTNAEILAVLADVSMAAPLDRTGFLLYCRLFREVMPDATDIHHASPDEGQEFYEQQADDLLASCRRKLHSSRGANL